MTYIPDQPPPPNALQRGRRSESTEIRVIDLHRLGDRVASKGPSIRVDGDVRRLRCERGIGVASKGPSIRVDGDAVHATAMQNGSRCFKGAVDQSRRRFVMPMRM